MAVLTGSSDNCGHVVKTTEQWGQTACRYQTIPRGLLCIEITPTGAMNAKVGVGNKTFIELPYLSGSGSIDLSNYYTKEETDERIQQIIESLGHIMCLRGKKESVDQLPMFNNIIGDVWLIPDSKDPTYVHEYVWTQDLKWELVGSKDTDIDLSEYAKKSYVDEKTDAINERIDNLVLMQHTHENKQILDETTAPYTTEDQDLLHQISKDYISSTDKLIIHCIDGDI